MHLYLKVLKQFTRMHTTLLYMNTI